MSIKKGKMCEIWPFHSGAAYWHKNT